MSANERGLGRGLDALFRNNLPPMAATATGGEKKLPKRPGSAPMEITSLPIVVLSPSQSQPRKHFDEQALEELAESIKSQGIVQPILVRPVRTETAMLYEIVAGERRWRAAQRAGLTDVPVFVREFSDEEALTAALIENLQREDLNPIEEARALQNLRDRLPLSQEELAAKLGKSRPAIANALRLLQLSLEMQEALREGTLTAGHARAILALPEDPLRETLYEAILSRHLSVRDAEAAVSHWKRHGVLPASLGSAAKPSRTEKPEPIKMAILQLRASLHPKASIAGTERMGRITLPYESETQLSEILEKLGLAVEIPHLAEPESPTLPEQEAISVNTPAQDVDPIEKANDEAIEDLAASAETEDASILELIESDQETNDDEDIKDPMTHEETSPDNAHDPF